MSDVFGAQFGIIMGVRSKGLIVCFRSAVDLHDDGDRAQISNQILNQSTRNFHNETDIICKHPRSLSSWRRDVGAQHLALLRTLENFQLGNLIGA